MSEVARRLFDPAVQPLPPFTETFWRRLDDLEQKHQLARWRHESALKRLHAARGPAERLEEVRASWDHYCESLEALDQAAAELAAFRLAHLSGG